MQLGMAAISSLKLKHFQLNLHVHLTLHTFMPPPDFTLHRIWPQITHYNGPWCNCGVAFTLCYRYGDKTNWTCFEPCHRLNMFSLCVSRKKIKRGAVDWNPRAAGSRVITECFEQGVEIAAAPQLTYSPRFALTWDLSKVDQVTPLTDCHHHLFSAAGSEQV